MKNFLLKLNDIHRVQNLNMATTCPLCSKVYPIYPGTSSKFPSICSECDRPCPNCKKDGGRAQPDGTCWNCGAYLIKKRSRSPSTPG